MRPYDLARVARKVLKNAAENRWPFRNVRLSRAFRVAMITEKIACTRPCQGRIACAKEMRACAAIHVAHGLRHPRREIRNMRGTVGENISIQSRIVHDR